MLLEDKKMIKVILYQKKQLVIWLVIELDVMLVEKTSAHNATLNHTT